MMVAEEKANKDKTVQEMFEEMLSGFYRVEKEVNKRVDQLDNKVDHLDTKVVDLNDKTNKMDNKIDKLDVKVEKLDRKVDDLDRKVDKNSCKLSNIARDIKTYKKLTLKNSLDIEFLKDELGEDSVY